MYLSYSGHKSYTVCPRQYWHNYVDKTKVDRPDNRVNALYGSTVGTLFERFYVDKLWRSSDVEKLLLDMAEPTLDDIVEKETSKGGVFDYADKASNYTSREKLLADVRQAIPRGVAIIRYHRLLGVDAAAEVKLDSWVEGHRIGGRADFILTRIKPHNDLVILDGKGSRHRDKYVDAWQLKWYAMLWREQNGTLPDKLGFIFWRYAPEESMDWVSFTSGDLDDLRSSILSAARSIDQGKARLEETPRAEKLLVLREVFPAKPSRDCKLCTYLTLCVEGQAYEKAEVPTALLDASGVEDIGV